MANKASLDVVVIGAGLSGLHAAALLEAQGLNVLVLEAQDRVGGRIHSMRQLGDNAEAGGTYIGAGYTRIIDTAEKHGIELIDVTRILEFFREQDLVLGEEIIRQTEWQAHPANPFPDADKALLPWNYHRVLTMRDNPLPSPEAWTDPEHATLDVPMHAWMQGKGLSDAAIKMGYGLNTTFGADANDVSALLLLFRGAFSKAQRQQAPKNMLGFTADLGVQRIPESMAAALSHEVALNTEVVAIDEEADQIKLRCADGSVVSAARVVCSLPFGVLRRIAIDPPLQGAQAEAVQQLAAQSITQVYLAPKTPFWDNDGYAASLFTDSLPGMVAAVRSGNDPTTVTHLTAWVIGRFAQQIDALSEADAGQRVIDAIEKIRPAARGQLELIGLQSWGGDPSAAGAWAYYRPGEVTRFAEIMGKSRGRIHFCGEHLALKSRGMEGAMETGERAAQEILSQDGPPVGAA